MKYTYLPMKLEQTECSEMSAYKIQTPGTQKKEYSIIKVVCIFIFQKVAGYVALLLVGCIEKQNKWEEL